jgi:hypothetical protein
MAVIKFVCPETLAVVSTGIDTDIAAMWTLRDCHELVACDACGKRHVWGDLQRWLDETPGVLDARNPFAYA